MFQRHSFAPSQTRGPQKRLYAKKSSVRDVVPLPRNIVSNDLRRVNITALANEREIMIRNSHPYTHYHWQILAEVIRATTTLKKLCFERAAVLALQNRHVVDALANNCTIKTLDLTGAGCGNQGANAVAAILKENSTIEVLRLGDNNISNKGAKAIADALVHYERMRDRIGYGSYAQLAGTPNPPNIHTIHLNNNRIGDEGAKAIAYALKDTTSLQRIDLGNNQIGVEGAKVIAEALKENHSLRELYIGGNNIGDEGTKALADALTSLRKLSIAYNYIGEEGGKHILNALRQINRFSKFIHRTIIDVSGSQISKKTMEQICQEENRIQNRISIIGANKGRAPGASMSKRSPQGDIHAETSSKVNGVAKEVQQTNSKAVHQITVMEEKVKELQSMYNAMENKVKQLQSTIAQQQDKLVQSDIPAMEAKIKELQSTVAQQQADLAQNDRDIAQKDKEIATMRMERSQQVGELRFTIAQLHGKITEQDKQIASMRTQRPQVAQKPDGHEVESDDLETYTRCCVCLEPYEVEPNSLGSQRLPIKSATCAHSLCEDCLGRYHASLMNGRSTVRYVRCPQCNDKTKKAFDIQNKVVDVFLREYIQCRKRKRLA